MAVSFDPIGGGASTRSNGNGGIPRPLVFFRLAPDLAGIRCSATSAQIKMPSFEFGRFVTFGRRSLPTDVSRCFGCTPDSRGWPVMWSMQVPDTEPPSVASSPRASASSRWREKSAGVGTVHRLKREIVAQLAH